jgi:hypothetical protein
VSELDTGLPIFDSIMSDARLVLLAEALMPEGLQWPTSESAASGAASG